MKARGDEGDPLPDVFPQLAEAGARLRRGQLHLFAAAPGGGKSAVASWIATNMKYDDGSPVPGLYFSPDSDKGTLGFRLAAGVLRTSVRDAEALLEDPDDPAWGEIESALSHVWFNWDQSPTLDDINKEIEAYVEVMGEYPHWIVIDNLKNMVPDNPGEKHVEYDEIMEYLKVLAGKIHSAVIVLHHVVGSLEAGNEKIPLSGLLGKPSKACRLIVTMFILERGTGSSVTLFMSIVKNSNGQMDASGDFGVDIPWNPEKSWFGE